MKTEPLLATLQVTFDSLPAEVIDEMGDFCMEALNDSAEAIDPMVSGNLTTGQLTLSFEFAASGDYPAGVRHGCR